MNTSATELIVPETNHRESLAEFVRWAVAQLGLDLTIDGNVARLQLPDGDQSSFDGQTELQLAMGDTAGDSSLESIARESRFGVWLLERLRASGPAIHSRPRHQPEAINDISSQLFAAYQVDGGQLHMGGCQLTDYPLLRISFAATDDGRSSVRHLFVAHDGSSVSEQQAVDLGLLAIEPFTNATSTKALPKIDDQTLRSLEASGRRIAAKISTSRNPSATAVEPLILTVVWVKHASGQLQATIGDSSVSLAFSGWAKLLKPQPFATEHSAAKSFHLAATDDGRIDCKDQIAICQKSGRRVLLADLVECSVSGDRVLSEFTETCPVTGKPTLQDRFATCSVCQQRVSEAAIEASTCAACHHLTKVKNDDPRLVWIMGEYQGLERWHRWQLAETQDVYIALAGSLMRRLLVVVDKESLAIRHLATSGRMTSAWTPLTGPKQDEILAS